MRRNGSPRFQPLLFLLPARARQRAVGRLPLPRCPPPILKAHSGCLEAGARGAWKLSADLRQRSRRSFSQPGTPQGQYWIICACHLIGQQEGRCAQVAKPLALIVTARSPAAIAKAKRIEKFRQRGY